MTQGGCNLNKNAGKSKQCRTNSVATFCQQKNFTLIYSLSKVWQM